ncbi:AAA family ATPase [Marivita lacus]|uniref:AAA family ATPase n=1 Tax=Marivita lacus TaxID=1323742 RepID=UPI001666C175|nr:AAA family ATPase [Marivita lacus]
MTEMIKLVLAEAPAEDTGRAFARIDPDMMEALGAAPGDIVELSGTRPALARVMYSHAAERGRGCVWLDAAGRENTGARNGDTLTLRRVDCSPAVRVTIASRAMEPLDLADLSFIANRIDGVPARMGDLIVLPLFDGRLARVVVTETEPLGSVIIGPQTVLAPDSTPRNSNRYRARADNLADGVAKMRYENVGGLQRELMLLREMVELPIRRPEIFARLGIAPPRGVLLHGVPGTGKTLLARAVASETDAAFFSVDAPSIMQKHYGESEAKLREVFDKARAQAPAIIFIDEIDAIASKRDTSVGEVEKRVVAQLLALMDGLSDRGSILLIAATNRPDALDPALRRPGRFDREIAIGMPDRTGRREILAIHTRQMPMEHDVDLDLLANEAHGFSGADLSALCREAAMHLLRRKASGLASNEAPPQDLRVAAEDFQAALADVIPSGLRELTVEIPETRWRDVGGHERARTFLTEWFVWPRHRPELFSSLKLNSPRGVVLHGPPGTGKTLLARALASEAGVNFLSVRGPELLSRYVGESERAVRELFETARRAAPCLLFFDEIDALAPTRGSSAGSDVPDRVVAQLLVEIDGVRPLGDVMLLAATNRLDRLDPALLRPGRFDLKLRIDLPSLPERLQILTIALAGRPVEDDVDLELTAMRTEGWSGAELRRLSDAAAWQAARRCVAMGAPARLNSEDFDYAFDETQELVRNAP